MWKEKKVFVCYVLKLLLTSYKGRELNYVMNFKLKTPLEENYCLHASFFKYCDAIWLADLLTLAWQNSSQTKEALQFSHKHNFTKIK